MRNSREITMKGKIRKIFPHKILLLAILLTFPPQLATAQEAGGGYAESYLLRNVGGRQVAMGGAYTAIANDPMAIFYNPGGLGFLEAIPTVSVSQTILGFNRTQSTAAWSQSFEALKDFGFGFGVNNFTTGEFVARDKRGNPIGDFTDWQISLAAGAAYRYEFVSVGASIKYLSNALMGSGGVGGNGLGLDLGAKFNVMDLFSFGLSVQNVTGMMFWNSQSDEVELLPYTVRAGLAMEFGLNEESYVTRSTVNGEIQSVNIPATRYVLVSLDASLTQYENAPTVTLGIEAVPHEYIAFRGGLALAGDRFNRYEFFPMTVWGGGVSFRPPLNDYNINLPFETNIDYAVSADYISPSKIAHHISLVFRF